MRPGNHAAADGSFPRSAGAAMGRGVLLLVVAFVIGIVLLNAADESPPGTELSAGEGTSSGNGDGDDGQEATGATSTTLAPPTTVAVRPAAEVKVLVANASDVKGAAGGATDRLKSAQFNALAPGNAAKAATSGVFFTAGYEREAAAVAMALELPAQAVQPIPTPPPLDPKTANIVVVLGADAASRFGTGAASATTTTAAPGTGSAATTTTTSR